MLGCLLAASQLHAHESGLHDLNHFCISCGIDDVTAHGAAPATIVLLQNDAFETVLFLYTSSRSFQTVTFRAIRAPPCLS